MDFGVGNQQRGRNINQGNSGESYYLLSSDRTGIDKDYMIGKELHKIHNPRGIIDFYYINSRSDQHKVFCRYGNSKKVNIFFI